MSQDLDPEQLRKVAEAATPGPWTLEYENSDDWESGINDGDYPYAIHGPRNCSFDKLGGHEHSSGLPESGQ